MREEHDPMAEKVSKTTSKVEKNPRNAAYTAAESRLRAAHPDEFQGYLQEECERRGLTYKRRLTEEEKARQMVLEAIEKYGEAVLPQVVEPDSAEAVA